MMRHWREREFERHLSPPVARQALGLWAWFAKRPQMYRAATRAGTWLLRRLARGRGRFASLPLAGGWTAGRDLPAPQGGTFMAEYLRRKRGGA
ncbi:MAG: DUF3390 domain-containing protein, partial [Alphaproteobacteria bacterium]|nr:DUF3390 domain-containing protein [Alphaproteobacteria bacterium]